MQTRKAPERIAETSLSRESFGDLLGELANNSAALVRDEIELARQEMRETVTGLKSGMITVVVGSLIGFVAVLALTAAAVICLATYVGYGNSALIIGALLLLIGGVTAITGMGKIRRTRLKPEQTIETLEEDKEWLKQLT